MIINQWYFRRIFWKLKRKMSVKDGIRLKKYVEIERLEVIQVYNQHMGRADKIDFLITVYRTFIRLKKWTLRMFAHAIDLAYVNAWIEYKKKASQLGVPKNKVLNLLHFRATVVEILTKIDKPAIRTFSKGAALLLKVQCYLQVLQKELTWKFIHQQMFVWTTLDIFQWSMTKNYLTSVKNQVAKEKPNFLCKM